MTQSSSSARVALLSAVLALVCYPLALADDHDVIIFRQLIMRQLNAEAAALGMIVSSQIPPDTLALQTRAIAASARAAVKAFEPKVPGGASKPEVWTKWADFAKRIELFATKSEEMAKASESGNVAVVMGLLVDALPCKQCHDLYRIKSKKKD